MNSKAQASKVDVEALCEQLRKAATELDLSGAWPSSQLQWCANANLYRWFIPQEFGGYGWSDEEIVDGYLALSQACMTTTFVLTQWNAACKRIIGSKNQTLKSNLLPKMATGELFATVGISHLTTSRQHMREPVLKAVQKSEDEFILNGFSPWVTGAAHADLMVLGATLPDHKQVICAVPGDTHGVEAGSGSNLVALTSSCTDEVRLRDVVVRSDQIVAGPVENVMQTNSGGGAGGLQTSSLAIGLAMAAVDFLRGEAGKRPDLVPSASKLSEDCERLRDALRVLTIGATCSITQADLRQQANSLVLRSTQAALSAAKGAGFVATHPTGRWAREALFFLVWSCPQPVVAANLCELAQIAP